VGEAVEHRRGGVSGNAAQRGKEERLSGSERSHPVGGPDGKGVQDLGLDDDETGQPIGWEDSQGRARDVGGVLEIHQQDRRPG